MKFLIYLFMLLFPIAGVITGNILGDMRNKSAGVVFFMWKGIQVFRKYVGTIANPKSVLQTRQRSRFKQVLEIGQNILVPILHVYWKHFAIKKSEINAFMSKNLKDFTGPLLPADLTFIQGQQYVQTPSASEVTLELITIEPLGLGSIDPAIFTKLRGALVNVVTGQVILSAPVVVNIVNPLNLSFIGALYSWNPADCGVYVWFEKTIVTGPADFTNSFFYALF